MANDSKFNNVILAALKGLLLTSLSWLPCC